MPAGAVEAAVGLDVGTTGVKAVAVSPDGQVLAAAERSYPLSTPRPGWAEQEPDDWRRAAEQALEALGVTPAGLGLSGQMHGLVALDGADRVLRPAILWNDQRTAAEVAERVAILDLLANGRGLDGFVRSRLGGRPSQCDAEDETQR